MNLFKDDFLILDYFPEENYISCDWQGEMTKQLDDDSLRMYNLLIAKNIETYNISLFFCDGRNFHYLLTVEFQKWHDEVIIPRYYASQLRRMAFVQSEDFVAQLSVEQTFDKKNTSAIDIRFFTDTQSAKQWLFS